VWTVLYVEDEENDAYFMRRAFHKVGMDECLRLVTDGQAAIDYLAGIGPLTNRLIYPLPAVVLLDLNLPTVSGFEVLKWIRHHAQLPELPVVIFSSSSRPEDRSKAKQLSANDYLEKPNSGSDFGLIVEALKQKWSGQPVEEGAHTKNKIRQVVSSIDGSQPEEPAW